MIAKIPHESFKISAFHGNAENRIYADVKLIAGNNLVSPHMN